MQQILSETSCFRIPVPVWDIPDMAGIEDLRGAALYDALMAFKPAELSETKWAEQAGVNRGFFSDLKAKPNHSPRNANLSKLMASVGKTVGNLGDEPEPNAVPFRMEGASAERMSRDIPIYGTALGADQIVDGEAVEQTTLNRAEVIEYKRRPPILDGRVDVYGLYVQGSSMSHRFEDGDTIYAESRKRPSVGDDAVIYLRSPDEHDGERVDTVLVKRVIRKTAAYVELEQFNPQKVFKIPMERVDRMDRVLTLDDMIG